MHPVTLIASALSAEEAPSPASPGQGICCVTGQDGLAIARKELLGSSFTDGALLAAPHSEFVGVDAYRALRYKWERMSSWYCDGESFQRLDRVGVREYVLQQPETSMPWCGYATISYKKHGALRARVNRGRQAVWLFETRLVDCSDRATLACWWQKLNEALRMGFGRSILETLDCPPFVMAKAGAGNWMAFESWAQDKHTSALYAFLCYLLPSQEELKHERI